MSKKVGVFDPNKKPHRMPARDVKLHDGDWKVYIHHTEVLREGKKKKQRATRVEAVASWGERHSGVSVCSHQDNFCRRTGRQMALKRLLGKRTPDFSRLDKAILTKAVVPEWDVHYTHNGKKILIDKLDASVYSHELALANS